MLYLHIHNLKVYEAGYILKCIHRWIGFQAKMIIAMLMTSSMLWVEQPEFLDHFYDFWTKISIMAWDMNDYCKYIFIVLLYLTR